MMKKRMPKKIDPVVDSYLIRAAKVKRTRPGADADIAKGLEIVENARNNTPCWRCGQSPIENFWRKGDCVNVDVEKYIRDDAPNPSFLKNSLLGKYYKTCIDCGRLLFVDLRGYFQLEMKLKALDRDIKSYKVPLFAKRAKAQEANQLMDELKAVLESDPLLKSALSGGEFVEAAVQEDAEEEQPLTN